MSETREQQTTAAAPAETPTAPPVPEPTGPGTAVAAQEQLRATEKPPSTILTEQPAEEAKPAEPEAPPPFDPEGIKFPEGFVKNDELFAEFTKFAKDNSLSQPVAQQALDLYAAAAKKALDANREAWNTTRTSWESEVRADPEIAKATLRTSEGVMTGVNAAVAIISRAILDNPLVGHPDLRRDLEVSAMGSNRPLFVTLLRLGNLLTEGGLVEGNGPTPNAGRPAANRPDAAGALYPNNPRGGAA